MTEGELYKKIEEIDNEKDFVAQDWLRFEADIKPILDEAKKEWLLIDDFRYNELGKGYISPEQARQDWFKKWFGSE